MSRPTRADTRPVTRIAWARTFSIAIPLCSSGGIAAFDVKGLMMLRTAAIRAALYLLGLLDLGGQLADRGHDMGLENERAGRRVWVIRERRLGWVEPRQGGNCGRKGETKS